MRSFPGFFSNFAVLASFAVPTLSAPGAVDGNNVGTYATPQYIVSLLVERFELHGNAD